jgi:hypothetical protein
LYNRPLFRRPNDRRTGTRNHAPKTDFHVVQSLAQDGLAEGDAAAGSGDQPAPAAGGVGAVPLCIRVQCSSATPASKNRERRIFEPIEAQQMQLLLCRIQQSVWLLPVGSGRNFRPTKISHSRSQAVRHFFWCETTRKNPASGQRNHHCRRFGRLRLHPGGHSLEHASPPDNKSQRTGHLGFGPLHGRFAHFSCHPGGGSMAFSSFASSFRAASAAALSLAGMTLRAHFRCLRTHAPNRNEK